MFDTNDVYDEAVRGFSSHARDNKDTKKSLMGSKVLAILLLAGVSYVGLSFYDSDKSIDKTLIVTHELISEIQMKPKLFIENTLSNSEENYLRALRAIESELIEDRESINLNTSKQMNLSSAMNNLVNDSNMLAENTTYTNYLPKLY